MKVNAKHPSYCHIRCTMTPSMRAGVYKRYLLFGREGELATICSATCECSTGLPYFNHVAIVLNNFLYYRLFQAVHMCPLYFKTLLVSNWSSSTLPTLLFKTLVTSLPCMWKAPKKTKAEYNAYVRICV